MTIPRIETGGSETLATLLSDDRLDDARDRAVAEVKAHPKNSALRATLAQLLALSGDLERADTHARLAQQMAPDAAVPLGDLRQTLRALDARTRWWAEGALPDFPMGPSAADRAALALNVALRGGEEAAVAETEAAYEAAHAPLSGTRDGAAFEGLRDLDDRLPHALEALTSGGHYLWLDLAKVAEVTLAPIAAPLDLAARRARVTLHDGSAADLRLAAVYDSPRHAADALARVTEFSPIAGGLTRAHGQRCLLIGEAAIGLHEIGHLTLHHG